MIDDGKMLNYIRQNVEMGIDGIDQISDHIHSREMSDLIMEQRQKYEDYFFKVDNMLRQNGVEAEDVPVMAKMSTTVMANMKNMTKRTDKSIAEDMIKGTNMGIIKLTGHLNDFHGSDEVSSVATDLLEYERKSIEDLKKFL